MLNPDVMRAACSNCFASDACCEGEQVMKPWIHEDCLELVTQLADMKCSASISNGIITLECGTQIDLQGTAKKEWKETRGEDDW
jgi:hypothetical protein